MSAIPPAIDYVDIDPAQAAYERKYGEQYRRALVATLDEAESHKRALRACREWLRVGLRKRRHEQAARSPQPIEPRFRGLAATKPYFTAPPQFADWARRATEWALARNHVDAEDLRDRSRESSDTRRLIWAALYHAGVKQIVIARELRYGYSAVTLGISMIGDVDDAAAKAFATTLTGGRP